MEAAKTDPVLKQYVLDALARAAASVRFDFVLRDIDIDRRVHTQALEAVAAAIRLDWVRVRPLSESPHADDAGAAYDNDGDTMHIDEDAPKAAGDAAVLAESRVVHEAIHAYFDIYACKHLSRATGEAAAYIAQAAFLDSRGQGPPVVVGTYANILRAAFAMLDRARSGATLARKDLLPVRDAVVAHYNRTFGARKFRGDVLLSLGLRPH